MKYLHKPLTRQALAIILVVATGGFLLPSDTGSDISQQVINQQVDPPQYIQRGLQWLVSAQYDNGGWGAGMHNAQNVRDPHQVQIDPATTAFATLALIRSGNDLHHGVYKKNVRKALMLMLDIVEASGENDPRITTIQGTQPQAKLGQNIDVAMASQLFTRVLPMTENDAVLRNRVTAALNKCLRKLQVAQNDDGSTSNGGWAGVLQSAMATSAMESAQAAGAEVDEEILEKARR